MDPELIRKKLLRRFYSLKGLKKTINFYCLVDEKTYSQYLNRRTAMASV